MARYTARVPAPISAEAAFATLVRFDRAADWDPGVESGVMLTSGPPAEGTRFELGVRFLGRTVPVDYEIVELEPGRKVVLRAETRTFRSVDTITVEHDGPSRSVVEYDARLEALGPGRLLEPVLGIVFRRIGDRGADGLRHYLAGVAA